jgi:hypothetical protein
MITKIIKIYNNQKKWNIIIGFNYKKMFVLNQPFYVGRADPFPLKIGSKIFLFFEEINLITRKGSIRFGELSNFKLIKIKTLLKDRSHYSFPFIFTHGGNIYLIPETSEKKTIELYEFKQSRGELVKIKNLINGIDAADTVLLKKDDLFWLFTSCVSALNGKHENLEIYYTKDFLTKKFIKHIQNPIYENNKLSRSGGAIIQNEYRISQDCTKMYGEKIIVSTIKRLNQNQFEEFDFCSIKTVDGREIHTYNEIENLIIADLKDDNKSVIIKTIICVKIILERLYGILF